LQTSRLPELNLTNNESLAQFAGRSRQDVFLGFDLDLVIQVGCFAHSFGNDL